MQDLRQMLTGHMEREGLSVNGWSVKAGIGESVLRNYLAKRATSITMKTLEKLNAASPFGIDQLLDGPPLIDTGASAFAETLKDARKVSGLSQNEVAERLGMSQSGYQEYEGGLRMPRVYRIGQIEEVLGLAKGALLGGGNATPPNPRPLDRIIYRAMEDALPDTMGVTEVRDVVTRQLEALRAAGVQLVAVGHTAEG